jgi:hypothetical protein
MPDVDDAVLAYLRSAGRAVTGGDIKAHLSDGMHSRAAVDQAWENCRNRIQGHPHVQVEKLDTGPLTERMRYRYVKRQPELSPVDALRQLSTGRLPAAKRAELAAVVQAGLNGNGHTDTNLEREWAARRHQNEIDVRRAAAELAAEVEELIDHQIEPAALVREVRAWVRRSDLEPIEQAGAETTFDRARHKPIGPSIRDGASVFVIRPGYIWKGSGGDVLIAKAVVEE